jgi:16S rRNA (adenine1518-N6/adenine1519-N6)-dimethyltransferase
MDNPGSLTRPRELRAYLDALGFHPSKSMGQNFLIDPHVRDAILDAAGVGPGDRVVEVGPGLGVMTEGLLERGASVLAIELDGRLVEHLRRWFGENPNLTLREGDATETDWAAALSPDPVHVVSNLPYSVGSRVLFDLAEPGHMPAGITVMVQSDVADRLCAAAGDEDYGLLTVRMAFPFAIRRVRNVPGTCFLPPPRVGSTVVHLARRPPEERPLADPAFFAELIKFAFSRRRKQLGTILRQFPGLAGLSPDGLPLDLSRRPETLSPTEWAQTSDALSERVRNR